MSDLFKARTPEAQEWRRKNGLWYVRFLSLHSPPTPGIAHPDALGPRMGRLNNFVEDLKTKGIFRAQYKEPDYAGYERRLQEFRNGPLRAFHEKHKDCAACKAIADGTGHAYWVTNGED